jgi:hypothetical protein
MPELLCEVCGNPVERQHTVCPWCRSPRQAAAAPAARTRRVVTVNLEAGSPTAAQALRHLKNELAACRLRGVRVVRAIHGYGSSGQGGKIRSAVRAAANSLVRSGLARSYLSGEDYDGLSAAARTLLNAEPELKQNLRSDRLNPGITLFLIS